MDAVSPEGDHAIKRDYANPFSLTGLETKPDPVEGNPFPENTLGHRVWKEATRTAEEESFRVNASRPPITSYDPSAFARSMVDLFVLKFDIWAKRGIKVVWSDPAIEAYDQWLFNYAQGWLDLVAEKWPFCSDKGPKLDPFTRSQVEGEAINFKSRLVKRMNFWKAEARRYVSEQKKFQEERQHASEPAITNGTIHGLSLPTLSEVTNRKLLLQLEQLGPEEKLIRLETKESGGEPSQITRRQILDEFTARVNISSEDGRFWDADVLRVAGYQDDKSLQKWVNLVYKDGSKTDKAFRDVLSMDPAVFRIAALRKRKKNQ